MADIECKKERGCCSRIGSWDNQEIIHMKKSLIAAACVLALSTAGAMAQSSQGNAGPGTMNNKSMNDPNARNDSGAMNTPGMAAPSGTTGMSNQGMNRDGMARNPSSQGNVGPGTNQGGAMGGSNMR